MLKVQNTSREEEFQKPYRDQENLQVESKLAYDQRKPSSYDRIGLYFCVFFIVIMVVAFLRAGQSKDHQITNQLSKSSSTLPLNDYFSSQAERKPTMGSQQHWRTPKILWVFTSSELQGVGMIQGMIAKHLIHVGRKSQFDVRIVNQLNAYDWISPETIERVIIAKHKSKYILDTPDLLRIALLIEHGGLSVKLSRYLFTQKLDWLYQLLEQPLDVLIHNQDKQNVQYCPNDKDAQIVLFYDKVRGGERVYEDEVIFARKGSKLLEQTFNQMCDLVVSGEWKYKFLINLQQMDETVQVKYISNMFIKLINFRQFYWFTGNTFCANYQVISINKNQGEFLLKIKNKNTLKNQLMCDKKDFFEKNGRRKMIEANIADLSDNFQQILTRQHFGIAHKNSIFRTDIIEIEGNEWMLKRVNKTRNVRYCIVSLKPLPDNYEIPLRQSTSRLQEQTYLNWHAVYFVQGLTQGELNPTSSVKLVNTTIYQGLNLQRAATKYCQQTDIALLLDYDQYLGHKDDLKHIEQRMSDKDIYGAFLSIKHEGKIYKPRFGHRAIRRKVMQPNIPLLNEIRNNFRVFSIYSYRLVPHMTLHDTSGRYFDREIPFLTLLEMAWDYGKCNAGQMLYHTKRVQQKMDIPKYRIVLHDTFIVMSLLKQIDIKQDQYKSKFAARTLCKGMDLYMNRQARDLRQFFILNNGSEFIGYQDRKNYPKLIQKKIHQMWVGNDIPKFKKFLFEHIKANHPDYEHYLWTDQNITRQNFPVSYNIIQTLLQFNKKSKYNKISVVSDLMRSEIIYNHGGIYIDTNYIIFHPHALDDWITYKAMFVSQIYPLHRSQREGGIFAAMKGYPTLKRLVDHRAISSRNFYSNHANIEAGPSFFVHAIRGEEQLDPDILQPSFEHIYPYYPFDDSNHKNLCQINKQAGESQILFKNKLAYRKDCASQYPWAFGMNFFSEGKSWA